MELMRGIDWYIMCIYQVGSGPSPIGSGPSPICPVMCTGRNSDGWQRVASNEGGSSQVGTDCSRMSTDRSQCSSGIRDCAESWAESWRLENAEEWGRAAPKADRFSSVQFSPTKLYKPWGFCTTRTLTWYTTDRDPPLVFLFFHVLKLEEWIHISICSIKKVIRVLISSI